MKTIGVLFLTVAISFVSCNQVDEKKWEKVLKTSFDNELETHEDLVKSCHGVMNKLGFLKADPRSSKTANEVYPVANSIRIKSMETGKHVIELLNKVLGSELFMLDDFDGLKTKGQGSNPFWMAKYDKQEVESLDRQISQYRNDLILTIGQDFKNRGKMFYINESSMVSMESFQEELKSIAHPNRGLLLDIYKKLDKVNLLRDLEGQSIIGASLVLLHAKNSLKTVEKLALKSCLWYVDKPLIKANTLTMLPVNAKGVYSKNSKEILKMNLVAYDSNQQFPVKYKINQNEIENYSGEIILDTKTEGKHSVKGELGVEVNGYLDFEPFEYTYQVEE